LSRYLVAGGAGFIGSHLCERLITAGHLVRVVDNLSTGSPDNLPDGAELWVGDVADRNTVGAAAVGVDGIFHVAGIASVARSTSDSIAAHRANQTTTVVILDVARAVGPIPVVFASSAAVYGSQPQQPLKESAMPQPIAAYGADKLGSELHARSAWRAHHVPAAALRIFNAFGHRQQHHSDYSGVVSVFIEQARKNCPLLVYGDGQQTRDFVHVTDVVRHLHAAMTSLETKPRFLLCNVCTGKPVTIESLARTISDAAGRRHLEIRFGSAPAKDIRHSCGDPALAIQELGICAETTLHQGLKALAADV
jgi:UDP-glucose 4-epimerase